MNRAVLQQLAMDRIRDAQILLDNQQWPGAFHMAGYALECGLKSCILKHLQDTGIIFSDRKYLRELEKDCWSHSLEKLVKLADLEEEFGIDRGKNAKLESFWAIAKDWDEVSRYVQKSEQAARDLFEAITNDPHGILKWIQSHW